MKVVCYLFILVGILHSYNGDEIDESGAKVPEVDAGRTESEIQEFDYGTNRGSVKRARAYSRRTINIKRGKVISTISSLPEFYAVSFSIKPTSISNGYSSVLHFTTGLDYGRGSRIPGILLYGDILIICNAVGGDPNYCIYYPHIQMNEWSSVTIVHSQIGLNCWYTVFVNGKKIARCRDPSPRAYKNVKVYATDPWYNPFAGFLRDLKISGNGIEVDESGSKVHKIDVGTTEREIQDFDYAFFKGNGGICTFQGGDGVGGRKVNMGNFRENECVTACIRRRRMDKSINGVTVNADARKRVCYCVSNMTGRGKSFIWKSCFIRVTGEDQYVRERAPYVTGERWTRPGKRTRN